MDGGTEMAQVLGHGSAREGTHHWTTQRLTAVANLALLTWLAVSLATADFSTHGAMVRWLSKPAAALPMILLIISTFTHLRLGLQVLIEDYLHAPGKKWTAMTLLQLLSWTGMISGVFFVAKLAFGA